MHFYVLIPWPPQSVHRDVASASLYTNCYRTRNQHRNRCQHT